MRSQFRRCRACGDYHWTDYWPANHVEPMPERSRLAAPMLNRDSIDPLWHPHNGHHYESKSEFRAVTKAAGAEEVGNDNQSFTPKADTSLKDDVAAAYKQVSEGYKPQLAITSATGDGWQ